MVSLMSKEQADDLANAAQVAEIRGRSLWQDAWARFMGNKAALASLVVLAVIVIFAVFGQFVAHWSNEEIDWSMLGSVPQLGGPSLENGHFFGVDETGREITRQECIDDMVDQFVTDAKVEELLAYHAEQLKTAG